MWWWSWSSRRGRSVQVKLIKMGGRVVRHSRRLIFQLSEVSVPRRLFEGVLDRIGGLSPAPIRLVTGASYAQIPLRHTAGHESVHSALAQDLTVCYSCWHE